MCNYWGTRGGREKCTFDGELEEGVGEMYV